jgi:hypothetical protein
MLTEIIDYIQSKLFAISLILALFLIDEYLLRPDIKENYFESSLVDFEYDYWKYFIIACVIIYILLLISLLIYQKNVKMNWKNSIFLVFLTILMSFFLDGTIRNTVLYFNTKIPSESFQKQYVIEPFGKSGLLYLVSNDEEILIFKSELDKINASRKKNNQLLIDDLKDKDTITVVLAKGFLDVNYLK